MTEQNAPWIESDGVNYIPMPYAVGVYEMRTQSETGTGYCLFNGEFFEPMTYSKEACETQKKSGQPTKYFKSGFIDAWRDYQGLMSKPTKVVGSEHVHQSGRGLTQAITYFDPSPYLREDGPVQPSDEPGIQRAAYAAKYEVKQETIPETIVLGSDRGQVSLTFNADGTISATILQTPAPSNTPLGIMTVWNERADHRLGMFQTGNIAD